MSIQELVDAIARGAAMIDTADLTSVVELQSRLQELKTAAAADGRAELAEIADTGWDTLNHLIMRDSGTDAEHVANVRSLASKLQNLEQGASDGAPARVDVELLSAWLPSVPATFDELANLAVEISQGKGAGERLATLKRGLHTIKGECGVIGLPIAQQTCHHIEDAIGQCEALARDFPVDAVLGVVDWLRSYAAALAKNSAAPAPDVSACEAQIQSVLAAESVSPSAPVAAVTAAAPTPAPTAAPAAFQHVPAADDDEAVELVVAPDMRENVPQFIAELRDHLTGAEQTLLALEEHREDRELLDALFRAFHTVKGVAGFMNLKNVVRLAHAAEALLDAARSGKLHLTPHSIDLVLKSTDLLLQLFAAVEGAKAPSNGVVRMLIGSLEHACGHGAHATEPTGSTAPAMAAPTTDVSAAANTTGQTGSTAGTAAAAPTSATTAVAPIPSAAASPKAGPAANGGTSGKTPATGSEASAGGAGAKALDTVVKVSTTRMDSLIDLVGELVIANQMVLQDPALRALSEQRLQRNLSHTAKIVRDLQETSMSLRMVAVKTTFQKMSRLVRDVATKTGKKIELQMEGEDTELDRTIVDQINDPLVHMIRNACDHGIESVEDRTAAGKSPTGTVMIRAFHRGGEIVIEVEDDGKGLDREKLIRKALEKGLIPPDKNTAEMSDTEVYNIIFLPGFSTADKVTDLSGRGVGMDVVRRNIEALRGKVDLRSTFGKGSTISMRLPLTLAIIDGMIVRVGAQRFVVPTLMIERSYQPRTGDIHSAVGGRGEMARVRDSLLPIFRLKELFEIREGVDELTDGLLIVVDANNTRCCLLVDEILGQQQVVIKSLGEGSGATRGVAGGAILGDGRVALILDVGGLLQHATTMVAA